MDSLAMFPDFLQHAGDSSNSTGGSKPGVVRKWGSCGRVFHRLERQGHQRISLPVVVILTNAQPLWGKIYILQANVNF